MKCRKSFVICVLTLLSTLAPWVSPDVSADMGLPVAEVGNGTSPGGRLRLSYDPPLYRDSLYQSRMPESVNLRIEFDLVTPAGHLESGEVNEIILFINDPDRRERYYRKLPAEPSQEVSLPLNEFQVGTSLIYAVLMPDRRAIAKISLTRHPGSANEVVFDAAGVCHVNGEPYLPIEIFHAWPGEALDAVNVVRTQYMDLDSLDWEGAVKEIASAGFNCFVDWQGMIDLEGTRARYDIAHRYGLKGLVQPVRHHGLSTELDTLADHPALLGWYVWDEPPPQITTILAQTYSDIRWLDPFHPIVAAAHTVDRVEASAPYRDVVMPDFYPGGGGDLRGVLKGADAVFAYAQKPVVHWPVVQAFEISHDDGRVALPRLTPDEMRALVFMNLANNARGIFYYAYWTSETAREPAGLRRTTPDYYARLYPDQWEAMQKINGELKQLENVILEPTAFVALKDVVGNCMAAWKDAGDAAYLICVNPQREEQTMRVVLADHVGKRAQAVFDGYEDIVLEDNVLIENLPPLAVRVYRLELQQRAAP